MVKGVRRYAEVSSGYLRIGGPSPRALSIPNIILVCADRRMPAESTWNVPGNNRKSRNPRIGGVYGTIPTRTSLREAFLRQVSSCFPRIVIHYGIMPCDQVAGLIKRKGSMGDISFPGREYYTGEVLGEDLAGSFGMENPFLWQTKPWDEEVTLYYSRARYYEGKTGRFLGVDPILVSARHLWDI